jgi:hypothetical protein
VAIFLLAVSSYYLLFNTYSGELTLVTRHLYPQTKVSTLARIVTLSKSPIIPLVSRLDFWGVYETIDYPNFKGFNPAILSLPSDIGTTGLVVVAREEYKKEIIDGAEVQPRHILAGLLNTSDLTQKRRWDPRDYPKLESQGVERLENLVHSHAKRFPKCEPDPSGWFWNNQGPEDGRLVWSHLGEPLLVYNSISPDNSAFCRHFYLVDLRSAYPALEDILSETAKSVPIRFPESMPLSFANQKGLHKNWAPFTNRAGEVFFHIDLIPQRIYRLKLDNYSTASLPTIKSHAGDLVTLEPLVRNTEEENCLSVALKRFPRKQIHQSTPFIEVVLCTSSDIQAGSCDPNDPNNMIYIGVIHALLYNPLNYESRIVVLNGSDPFNYLSISKPLMYGNALQCPLLMR